MGYREELDTPASVVHLGILRGNIERMAAVAAERGLALRPHVKTHKTAAIAAMQLAAGAVGLTCAKLGEAEALVDAGIEADLLIANQIVGDAKLRRLLALLERTPAPIRVGIDGEVAAAQLDTALAAAGRSVDVLIEVNTGHDRAGTLPGPETIRLAGWLREHAPRLRLAGVFTHEGHAGVALDPTDVAARADAAWRALAAAAAELRVRGFAIEIVSVGSTPALAATRPPAGVSEIRPGTYVFNDASLFRLGRRPRECALRVLATVTSRPAPDRAILDAGSKALAADAARGRPGFGAIVDAPEATIERLNEEHATVRLPEAARSPAVGDRVEIIPNHVCPTVNLADELIVVAGGAVVDVWPVVARGRSR